MVGSFAWVYLVMVTVGGPFVSASDVYKNNASDHFSFLGTYTCFSLANPSLIMKVFSKL